MSDDHTPQLDASTRTVISGTPLHAGAVVYRVIEIDPPADVFEQYTWEAAAVSVERVSAKQIKLKRPFRGLARTVFDPTALGRLFFETPGQAIQYFLKERCDEIVSIDRRRKEASRALTWAESQILLDPAP